RGPGRDEARVPVTSCVDVLGAVGVRAVELFAGLEIDDAPVGGIPRVDRVEFSVAPVGSGGNQGGGAAVPFVDVREFVGVGAVETVVRLEKDMGSVVRRSAECRTAVEGSRAGPFRGHQGGGFGGEIALIDVGFPVGVGCDHAFVGAEDDLR